MEQIRCNKKYCASKATILSAFPKEGICYKAYNIKRNPISKCPSKAIMYNARSMEGSFVETVPMCGNR
jgi:hypothetical protein